MSNPKLSYLVSAVVLFSAFLSPLRGQQLSDAARQQMADLLRLKQSLTTSQRKLSSRLVLATMKARNQTAPAIPDALLQQSPSEVAGGVLVDVKADSMAEAITQINAVGGTILSNSATDSVIRARIPVLSLETVAASDAIHSIRSTGHPKTNSATSAMSLFVSPTAPLSGLQRLRTRTAQEELPTALPLLAANGFYPSMKSLLPLHLNAFIGAVTSQGYVTHTANQVNALGVMGTGVRVGVLSDSASAATVAYLVGTGDLPSDVVVVPGQAGSATDEGAAMMEIVHDLAPAAKLFFATAFSGEQSFADNIRTLRFTYNCDVIVDDVSYSEESPFQDAVIAQAVNDVTADGALYFSSGGNDGNFTSGYSGTWEGDFQSAGDAGAFLDAGEGQPVQIHNFAFSGSPAVTDVLTAATSDLVLQWSDPLGASANDYDFFLFDSTGTQLLDFSVDTQDGTQDPIEEMYNANNYPPGSQLVVVLFNGDPRALHVSANGGLLNIATPGAVFGHNGAASTVTMAATAWNSAHRGTAVFSAANPVEIFSSDGPRQIFYNPDGSAITPGNFLFSTNGGQTLQKPDLTAADGIFAKTPGFLPFFGTSAAAPHAAAIAALVKSANPGLTNAQIRQILVNTAVDTMAPGPDRDSGYGIAMALSAVRAALAAH